MFNQAINVSVQGVVRPVTVEVLGPKYSRGFVGKAFFVWKSDQYDLPLVRIKGRIANEKTRRQVKAFLMEYKKMLLASKKKSPLHFKESEVQSSISQSGNENISGVPMWMREEHKVWTECHKKDGTTYMRRTRFKPESREIVEEYLPHCSKCVFRVNCEKPCENPDLMCQAEAFQKETTKVNKQQTSNQK